MYVSIRGPLLIVLIVFGHFVFIFPWVLFLSYSGLVVSNSASDRLERVVLKVAYTVLLGTLNPAHLLIFHMCLVPIVLPVQ